MSGAQNEGSLGCDAWVWFLGVGERRGAGAGALGIMAALGGVLGMGWGMKGGER